MAGYWRKLEEEDDKRAVAEGRYTNKQLRELKAAAGGRELSDQELLNSGDWFRRDNPNTESEYGNAIPYSDEVRGAWAEGGLDNMIHYNRLHRERKSKRELEGLRVLKDMLDLKTWLKVGMRGGKGGVPYSPETIDKAADFDRRYPNSESKRGK